jgi:hypothetical protein
MLRIGRKFRFAFAPRFSRTLGWDRRAGAFTGKLLADESQIAGTWGPIIEIRPEPDPERAMSLQELPGKAAGLEA